MTADLRPVYIYALCEPGTNTIRYIGKSDKPAKRYQAHIREARYTPKRCHRLAWISKIVTRGELPKLLIIDTANKESWYSAEKHYIAMYRSHGYALVNGTDGGEGVAGLRHSAASRQKMAQAKRGKTWSEEQRAKYNAVKDEAAAKIATALRGRKLSPERKAKIGASLRGRTLSAEHRAALSAARLRRTVETARST